MSSALSSSMNPPKPDWDAIDQASLESFPASDPPARGGARAAPSESTVSDTAPPSAAAALPRSKLQPRRLAQIGLGVLAGGTIIGLAIWRMRARGGGRRARWF